LLLFHPHIVAIPVHVVEFWFYCLEVVWVYSLFL
jgi:hypothetical protein